MGSTDNVSAPRPQIDPGYIAIDREANCEVLRPRKGAFGLFIDEMQDLEQDFLAALVALRTKRTSGSGRSSLSVQVCLICPLFSRTAAHTLKGSFCTEDRAVGAHRCSGRIADSCPGARR